MVRQPIVTIGLPVYNGEKYLAASIESILEQSFRDFHLIISDNASQDGTADICRHYARHDDRIRYRRHESNRGAAPNFSHCFHISSGDYFKWHAHDDMLEPTYLERCVTCLQGDPDAVLCQSMVTLIDHDGAVISRVDPRRLGLGAERPSERLGGVFRNLSCVEIFGVIRRDALARTALIGEFIGSDRALLADLALAGRFVVVAEPLFRHREHPGRSVRLTRAGLRPSDVAAWFSPAVRRNVFQRWTLYATCWRLIRRRVASAGERMRCHAVLVASLRHRWGWAFMVLEPLMAIDPRAYDVAKGIKRTLAGLGLERVLLPVSWRRDRVRRSPN